MSTFGNATTLNEQEDFITTLYDQLEQQDIPVELIHSESAPGQLEVVLRYSDNVLNFADDVVYARETVTNGMVVIYTSRLERLDHLVMRSQTRLNQQASAVREKHSLKDYWITYRRC